jgi:hypothetical protein
MKERVECPISGLSQCEDRTSIENSLNRTIRTMQLLRKVRSHTFNAIEAWKGFSARNGDIQYLMDSPDNRTKIALSKIQGSFSRLAILEQKLVALDESCKDSVKTVGCLAITKSLC